MPYKHHHGDGAEKEEKVMLVVVADRSAHVGAVVVEPLHAPVRHFAVLGPGRLKQNIYKVEGPFCTVSAPPRKQKIGTLTDFRRKNDGNFGLCLFYLGYFSTKERNICLFLFVLANFSLFFNKQNPTYLEFYRKSVSYNRNL